MTDFNEISAKKGDVPMTNLFGIETRPDKPPFDRDKVRAVLKRLSDQDLIDLSQEPEPVIQRRIEALLKTTGTLVSMFP